MNTTKSFIVAALLASVAAVSFAQAPRSSMDTGSQPATVAKTAPHKKNHHHRHHHHLAHHGVALKKMASANH